ncbi:MAG TPA: methylated-DNA--[protein]-cysteine S-methyltransferase [Turneriella sp.]|nr:methylated-DNA--[protein]-cysteine S-methyltransferase [Turneriella sp.]
MKKSDPPLYYTYIKSPIDKLCLISNGGALTHLLMEKHRHAPHIESHWIEKENLPIFNEATRQLNAYFSGKLKTFNLPIDPSGTTFQKRVWRALMRIPYGETLSYGQLAHRVGNPNASRAVGLANGRNPISIIIPCHRVIGASGSLTGYGGGVERKRFLLELEGFKL